jgi:hypothetical protein
MFDAAEPADAAVAGHDPVTTGARGETSSHAWPARSTSSTAAATDDPRVASEPYRQTAHAHQVIRRLADLGRSEQALTRRAAVREADR